MVSSSIRAFFLVPFLFAVAAPGPVLGQAAGTVGVLPFTNITGSPADAWIGAGIAETLVADLQGTPGLTVVTRERLMTAFGDAGLVTGGAAGEGRGSRRRPSSGRALGRQRRVSAAWR